MVDWIATHPDRVVQAVVVLSVVVLSLAAWFVVHAIDKQHRKDDAICDDLVKDIHDFLEEEEDNEVVIRRVR